jgi:hypothetical protein
MADSYEQAHPCDQWTLRDGETCWMTGGLCTCGLPLATNGRTIWCTGGCEGKQPGETTDADSA